MQTWKTRVEIITHSPVANVWRSEGSSCVTTLISKKSKKSLNHLLSDLKNMDCRVQRGKREIRDSENAVRQKLKERLCVCTYVYVYHLKAPMSAQLLRTLCKL